MKIAVRGGHNFSVPGSRGIIDETTEDRKVKNAVIKYLRIAGHEVMDVTSPDSENTVLSDLEYGVNKANDWGAELFVSCHFNNAYDHYEGAIGTEIWTYSENFKEAVGVNCKMAELGFINRGMKHSTGLFELRKTNMKSMIVETCFVEASKDVELYRSLGADRIGKAIAEGIHGSSINDSAEEPVQTGYGIVTASVLNVRSGAGTGYPVIGQVHKGDRIKLDVKIGNWYSTYWGDHGGFMSADYLRVE